MKYLYSFIITLLMCNYCIAQNSQLDIFDDNEKSILIDLLSDFDTVVMRITGKENISEAYLTFSNSLKYNDSYEEFHKKLNKLNPACQNIISKYQDKEVFNEIWVLTYGFANITMEDTLSTELSFKWDGKYFTYLKNRGENNEVIESYFKSVQSAGTVPPSLKGDFPHSVEKFDLEKIEDRIIFAIHYLTLMSEKKYKSK